MNHPCLKLCGVLMFFLAACSTPNSGSQNRSLSGLKKAPAAPASPGNSGGPLMNEKGEVVGVVVKKNSNENLNYALPIQEALKVPTGKAEFYIKNDSFSVDGKSVARDWRFSAPLPASLATLSDQAQRSRKDFRLALVKDYRERYSAEMFPREKRVGAFLRSQQFSVLPASVDADQQKNWMLSAPKYQKIQVGLDQEMYFGKVNERTYKIFLEKPKEVELAKFIESPKMVMDTLVTSIGWSRPFANEQIKIRSYGEPVESKLEADRAGRPWTMSVWRTSFDDSMHFLDCTTAPKGVACVWMYLPNAAETFGIREIIREERNEFALSYADRLDRWRDYLALPKKFLPTYFQNASLKWAPGKSAEIALGGFDLSYHHGKIQDDSALVVEVGFNIEKPELREVFTLAVVNRFDKNAGAKIITWLPPDELSSSEKKNDWKDFQEAKAPYNGSIATSGNTRFVSKRTTLGRAPASVTTNQRQFLTMCFEPTDDHEQNVVGNCDKAIKVRRLPE